jgi:uncharacterized protein DUF6894
MPRYYFHLRHPRKRVMDCEGVMLRDAAAAREQAELTVRDFFRPALNAIEPGWEGCSVEVRDARGCLVVDIAITEAARLHAEAALLPIVQAVPAKVVHLDLERARREFAAVERRARELLHRTHRLVEQQRTAAESLAAELRLLNLLRNSAVELVARARQQSSIQQGGIREAVNG